MSTRRSFKETIRILYQEYKNVEFSDRILDLISVLGIVFFVISLFSINLFSTFNVINIVFALYPLGLAGIAASFRMKRRDKPEETEHLFKEWLAVNIILLVIIAFIILIAIILY